MKKSLSVMLLSAGLVFASCAQKMDASKVPASVKESFTRQFPGSAAKWEKEDGRYEAVFKYGEHEMSAVFEATGLLSESEIEIKIAELPAAVTNYIKINHSSVGIKAAAKITKSNGEVQYEAEVKGKDLIFDANGNFIKEIKE